MIYSRQQSPASRSSDNSATASGDRRAEPQHLTNDAYYGNQTQPAASPTTSQSASFPIALKLSLYFGLPLLLGMGFLAAIMLDSQRTFQQQQMDSFAQVITKQLAASSAEPLFASAYMELAILTRQTPLDGNVIGIGIVDHKGGDIVKNGRIPLSHNIHLTNEKSVLSAIHFYQDMGKQHADIDKAALDNSVLYIEPIRFRNVTGGYVLVVLNQSAFNHQFEQMGYTLLSATVLMAILLACIILYCSYRVTAPLKSIVNAANRIQDGDRTPILNRRNDELGQLINAINTMTQGLAEKSQIETALGKFLAPDVAEKILREIDTVNFRGENVEATVLFADIVGYTSLSEKLSPSQTSELLNEYFGYYSACAKFYFGTVDKFLGDCIMLVFGASKTDRQHQYHAAACAVLMQKLTAQINHIRIQQGLAPVYLRIGINSGTMLAGLLGSQDRVEYTVVGDSVNLASRLCNEARQDEIIIQNDLYQKLQRQYTLTVDKSKTIRVRGKTDAVPIFNLKDISRHRNHGDQALMSDLLETAKVNMTPL